MSTQFQIGKTVALEGLSKRQLDRDPIGHLTFWSVRDTEDGQPKIYDPLTLVKLAEKHDVPVEIKNSLTGKTPFHAWQKATNLGSRGQVSERTSKEDGSVTATYQTRNMSADLTENPERIIIREVLDPDNKIVSVENMAYVSLTEDYKFHVELAEDGIGHELQDDVMFLAEEMMAKDYQKWIGTLDGTKLRTLLIKWCHSQNAITIRLSGGVYKIPRPESDLAYDQQKEELMAITNWLSEEEINGLLNCVEVYPSDTTTTDGFLKVAIDEVKAEAAQINEDLQKHQDKGISDNVAIAGSQRHTAGTVIERISKLRSKVHVLRLNLGEELAVGIMMLDAIEERANRFKGEADTVVTAYQDEKRAKKEREKAAKKNGGTVKARKPKRQGNARPRSKKTLI